MLVIQFRRYLLTHFTWKTLSNHVFEDLRKLKAPNNVLTNKSGKVVVKYVGAKHKGSKTYVWVPKMFVSNVKGPKTVWVSKNKA
jgi:hypothetical protein